MERVSKILKFHWLALFFAVFFGIFICVPTIKSINSILNHQRKEIVQLDSSVTAFNIGINDGDTVIVKKTPNVDSGQIAVVLIDDQEATLKRIRKKGNTIALESANRNYGTKIYASNRIKIQGKLVSLYRNFH